jgi:hypothetical protein
MFAPLGFEHCWRFYVSKELCTSIHTVAVDKGLIATNFRIRIQLRIRIDTQIELFICQTLSMLSLSRLCLPQH